MIEDIKQEMEDNANYYDEDDEGNVDLPKIIEILDKYKINQKDNSLTIWEHYKDYYKDTNKEDILWDTYLDYCAWINNIKYSKEIQSQLDKYKNAWEELKSTVLYEEPYDDFSDSGYSITFAEQFDIFDNLEEKYNMERNDK